MAASFSPSASKISARFSRSAFICRAIALTKSWGGAISLISIRVTLTPQGSVASSTFSNKLRLILSRLDNISSNSIEPNTARMLVMTKACMALSKLFTSYAALAASCI